MPSSHTRGHKSPHHKKKSSRTVTTNIDDGLPHTPASYTDRYSGYTRPRPDDVESHRSQRHHDIRAAQPTPLYPELVSTSRQAKPQRPRQPALCTDSGYTQSHQAEEGTHQSQRHRDHRNRAAQPTPLYPELMSITRQAKPQRRKRPNRASQFISSSQARFKMFRGFVGNQFNTR